MKIQITELSLDPKNARKHSKRNLEAIAASLSKFGQRKPIVVHRGVVLAGNGTLEAAKSLGWTEIDVAEVPEDWDNNTAKAYALADNRTAELAEWDESELAKQLLELDDNGWNIAQLGFEIKDNFIEEKDTEEKPFAERYEVVIECDNEDQQSSLLLRLSEEGLKVRAIVI
jgi:ParB-like chromosome segregation protein Spo0J